MASYQVPSREELEPIIDRKVWVGKVKSTVSPKILKEYFEDKVGPVAKVETGFGGFAFVEFEKESHAKKAIETLHNKVVVGVGEIALQKSTINGYRGAVMKQMSYWKVKGQALPAGRRLGGRSMSRSRSRGRSRSRTRSRSQSQSPSRGRNGAAPRDRRSLSGSRSRSGSHGRRGSRCNSSASSRRRSPVPCAADSATARTSAAAAALRHTSAAASAGSASSAAGAGVGRDTGGVRGAGGAGGGAAALAVGGTAASTRTAAAETASVAASNAVASADAACNEGSCLGQWERSTIAGFFDGAGPLDLLTEVSCACEVPDDLAQSLLSAANFPHAFPGVEALAVSDLVEALACFTSGRCGAESQSAEVRQEFGVRKDGRRFLRKSLVVNGGVCFSTERLL
eukprot:TRINITY_DN3579_c0_g1_i2.p1 TRINITY_DN3579_c0_g1~~TRINITY_DN3579_c0_g1_i2.p1  ORF type:complete len:398 (-),score=86.81 TRINITY_DN3579_c0_g1_i2:90-1283(-)